MVTSSELRAAVAGGPERANVVVYLVDTLRARSIGAYGDGTAHSPEIDAFSEESVLIERGLATSSWTRASIGSLMTGRWTRDHGAIGREDALPDEVQTVAEVLSATGYETAAFVTNGNVGRGAGFAQGFEHFRLLGERDRASLHASGDEVNDAVFEWMDARNREDPFFLYVHTMEPHDPYTPDEKWRRRFSDRIADIELSDEEKASLEGIRDNVEERFGEAVTGMKPGSMLWMHGLVGRKLPWSQEMARTLGALYAGEVAEADRQLGDFLSNMRARGVLEDSIVVFVSDHGEEFLEHGKWVHGRQLYQESIRVPMLVRFPGARVSGVWPDVVSLVDVMPTLLSVVGARVPESVAGREVWRLEGGERPAFSWLDLDGRRAASVVEWPWKLIRKGSQTRDVELYRLDRDPREQQDVARGEEVIRARLEALLDAHERYLPARAKEAPAEIAPEVEEKLKALGYGR